MSYPRGTLHWTPLPGGQAHVVMAVDGEGPAYCGKIDHGWLLNVTGSGHEASATMVYVADCDHGGTYHQPRSVWTGKPVPTTP